MQQQLKVPEFKLIQDVATRWNSTYMMIWSESKNSTRQSQQLCLLGKSDLCISAGKIQTTNDTIMPLSPGHWGGKWSEVCIYFHDNPPYETPDEGCNICPWHCFSPSRRVWANETIFSNWEAIHFGGLDPARSSVWEDFVCRPCCNRYCSSEVNGGNTNHYTQPTQYGNSIRRGRRSPAQSVGLWATFDEKVARAQSHRTTGTDSFVEIRRYFEGRVVERKEDPLEWWEKNGPQFPHIAVVAARVLAIPGSSVLSEQLFSKAGELISQRRCQLKPKNVNTLLFLNKNL